MCERISGISIEGAYFNVPCILAPFALTSPQGKPRYISIVYGKNGSGKTSLAQGFYEVVNGNNVFTRTHLIDHDGNPINDIAKDRIFVFDENYIRKIIKFTEDGLDSVVMLGEQVDLDEQIKTLEFQLTALNKEIEADKLLFNASYEIATSPLAPEYHQNAIRENLRQNWSVRESNIKGMRQNAPVRDDFISLLFQNGECSALEDIRVQFEAALTQLKLAQSGDCVNNKLTKIVEDEKIESNIISLLEKKISAPVLSDREKLIMQIIKDSPENENFLMRAKTIFSKHDITICPLCLQDIDADYKNILLNSISNVFDTDEATQHREELSSITLTSFEIDLHHFRVIDSSLCDKIQGQIDKYNQTVTLVKENISRKLSSIYSPLTCAPFDLHKLQICINKDINLLEQSQDAYNKNINSIVELKAKLTKLNKDYAREEIRHINVQYKKQLSEKESKKYKFPLRSANRNDLKTLLKYLMHKRKIFTLPLK